VGNPFESYLGSGRERRVSDLEVGVWATPSETESDPSHVTRVSDLEVGVLATPLEIELGPSQGTWGYSKVALRSASEACCSGGKADRETLPARTPATPNVNLRLH
jgi:hypothetical protein